MSNEERINEIMNAIHSFSKDVYHKEELLPEYLELQKELVNLTFNDSHAENGKLQIWDVEKHLEKLNIQCGHIVDEELELFMNDSKFICNAIKSELSGNAGEYKTFRTLETLRCNNKVMKNVELKSGDRRTEIDAIVFTEKAIFIIEVKNPRRDICIDNRGNYFRIGNKMHLDCNIGEKMNDKVFILREILESYGYPNANIESFVVFTNSAMQVENKYEYITTCFLSNLPHLIERYDNRMIYNDTDITDMINAVKESECKEAYPLEVNIDQYKYRFANIMTIFEEAITKRSNNEEEKKDKIFEVEYEEPYQFRMIPQKTINEKTKVSRLLKSVLLATILGVGVVGAKVLNSKKGG